MEKQTNNFITRPPIVVVMGHIDHGKSKLLDYIRKSNIVEGEAGGITQHIGAYEVEIKCESKEHSHGTKKITFLDTPGHESFSKMRARGAKIADIAVLVVAVDEGPKPQTIEAYKSIEEADIPFIVALNKIDKPNANIEQTKTQLAENQIFLESYGGKIPSVNISAKEGEGVDELLDLILLMAEMENLQGDSSENASGIIVESNLDSKRGISSTLVIQNGTIKKGMFIASGNAIAPVRIFENFHGEKLETATFSSPIRITGFDGLPCAGAEFKTFNTKKEAEEFVASATAITKQTNNNGNNTTNVTGKEKVMVPVIIKSDVSGSIEAIEKEILKLQNENVCINILRTGTGNIVEEDVKFASSAKNAIILGFNVNADASINNLAERLEVEIKSFNIIYKLSEWLGEEVEKRNKQSITEISVGTVKVLKIFNKAKNCQVFGGKVLQGKISTGKTYLKIKRDDEEIGTGKIVGIQHNKVEAKEVGEGKEFGAMLESKTEIMQGDLIEIIEKLS